MSEKCPKCFVVVRKSDRNPSKIVARFAYEGCEYCNPDKKARDKRRNKTEALLEKFDKAGFKDVTFHGSEGRIEISLDDAERLLDGWSEARAGMKVVQVGDVQRITCMCGPVVCKRCGNDWTNAHEGPNNCPKCGAPVEPALNAVTT